MKLSKIIQKSVFLTAILSVTLAFLINLFFEYQAFQDDKQNIRKEYLEIKKELIRNEVLKAYDYISFRENKIKDELKETLKKRVNLAHNIANDIYQENKGKKSDEEIKYLIVTALKNINFKNRDYYFINSNDGKAILFNKNSKLNKNINVWNLQDIKGQYIIQKQSKIALTKNEGFVTSYFKKPDLKENKQYPKISYIKNFKPFNWHIGTGKYLDDLEKEIKNEILEYLASIRFNNNGYIYVNHYDKKALVFDGKKLKKAKEYTNTSLFNKQLNAIKDENDGFFFYKFKKLNTAVEFPKLGFVKSYDKWKWIIGSGVYIDEVDMELLAKEKKLKEAIINEAFVNLNLLLIIIFILYLISKKISLFIENNINNLTKEFDNSLFDFKEIDTKKLSFDEFKYIANDLNKVIRLKNLAENRIKENLDIINNNICINSIDKNALIIDVNHAFCKLSNYKKDELLSKSLYEIYENIDKEKYKEIINETMSNNKWKGELILKSKNDKKLYIKVSAFPKYNDNEFVGVTFINQDISDKKRVEYLSITDELTKLYNRRYFNEIIEKELNKAKRNGFYFSLLMIDIDYFKMYNDTYGHQKGDVALVAVSNIINKNMKRSTDYGFRLGGEEFGVIFSQKENPQEILSFANKLKDEVEALKIDHKNHKSNKYVTISIGLVIKNAADIKNSSELYKEADMALYEAKAKGRNFVYQES